MEDLNTTSPQRQQTSERSSNSIRPIRFFVIRTLLPAIVVSISVIAHGQQNSSSQVEQNKGIAERQFRLQPEVERDIRDIKTGLDGLKRLDAICDDLKKLPRIEDVLVGMQNVLIGMRAENKVLLQRVEALESLAKRPPQTPAATESKLDMLVSQLHESKGWKPGLRLGPPISDLHIPKGNDLPPTEVIAISSLEAKLQKNPDQAQKLGLVRAQEALPSTIVFQRIDASLDSGRIIGNGALIAPTKVLTAKHVADQVRTEFADKNLLILSYAVNGTFTKLEYESSKFYSESADPDLALITLKSPAGLPLSRIPNLSIESPVGTAVFFVGAWELSAQPNVGTGIVTTRHGKRSINEQLRLTVQGTSIGSFAGQSGSPVYNADTGELYGIFVAGWKWFSRAGETVYDVPPKDKWESFPDWSWIVPVQRYVKWITENSKGD